MADLELRTNLSAASSREKVEVGYPYIHLDFYGDELPVVLECLEEGPIPVLLSNEGMLMQIATVRLSARVLEKLSRIYNYTVVLSEVDQRPIRNISDILEVIPWMLS